MDNPIDRIEIEQVENDKYTGSTFRRVNLYPGIEATDIIHQLNARLTEYEYRTQREVEALAWRLKNEAGYTESVKYTARYGIRIVYTPAVK